MGPQLLIDTSSLINRIGAPLARGSKPAAQSPALTEKQADARTDQGKALVAGTLLFFPFLVAYIALSCQQ